jgi:butyryl-CoA dehydrogenase
MSKYMSMETLRFLLHDVHKLEDLYTLPRFQDYDKDSVDIILDSAKEWADKEFYPYYKEMDEKPAYYKDGRVKSHPQVGKVLKTAGENGWVGPYFDYDLGGMQMPDLLMNGINHIIQSANNHLPGYIGLTAGSAHLIATFGSDELKQEFIPNMLKGIWGGTMCLTEPQAGSSLSDVSTSAVPLSDGSYKVKGQKIFISGGDHEGAENFIHLALVRIEGAPAGTKGISLFVIPRLRKQDGEFVFNDVITAGDFQKMGQKGYSTVHLLFGESDDCIGYLVGEENMGLKYMFQMMNGARIDVGMTAASTATAAYYASLHYAKERPQGRRIESSGRKNVNAEQTLIINHADVRRMLLLQKAITEGALSLLLEASKYHDLSQYSENEEEREISHLLLEILTPMAKTYPSEMGKTAIDNGLQVLGGYGFCEDFILQQYYRDIRIMSIYEGTTGIQSIDLLGRKVTMKNGKAIQLLMGKLMETIQDAKTHHELVPYCEKLSNAITKVQEILAKLIPLAMSGEYELFLADATKFMEMTSNIVIGYQWIKIAKVSKEKLIVGNTENKTEFYENMIHTMKFYFKYELPKVNSCYDVLMNDEVLTIKEEEKETIFT